MLRPGSADGVGRRLVVPDELLLGEGLLCVLGERVRVGPAAVLCEPAEHCAAGAPDLVAFAVLPARGLVADVCLVLAVCHVLSVLNATWWCQAGFTRLQSGLALVVPLVGDPGVALATRRRGAGGWAPQCWAVWSWLSPPRMWAAPVTGCSPPLAVGVLGPQIGRWAPVVCSAGLTPPSLLLVSTSARRWRPSPAWRAPDALPVRRRARLRLGPALVARLRGCTWSALPAVFYVVVGGGLLTPHNPRGRGWPPAGGPPEELRGAGLLRGGVGRCAGVGDGGPVCARGRASHGDEW